MAERFLLGSSAFIAFLQAEPGAPRVLDLLERAARAEVEVVACFVSLTEVQYITSYDYGEEPARKANLALKWCMSCNDAGRIRG